MRTTPVALTYAVSALLACATYCTVYRPLEASIAARYDAMDDLREDLARDRRIVAQADDVARAAQALRTRIGSAEERAAPTAVLARFLAVLNDVAVHGDIAVEAVAPRPPAAAQLGPASSAPKPDDDLNLDLTLRGSYARVIRVVRALDRRIATARLTVANLRVARQLPGSPTEIDATFHVTLLGADPDATLHPAQHSI